MMRVAHRGRENHGWINECDQQSKKELLSFGLPTPRET